MIDEVEVRASQETAMQMKEKGPGLAPYTPFGAALGIPLIVSEDVPVGKAQFWQDGKMVKEVDVEL